MNNVAPAPSSSEGKLRLELGERSYDILVDTNLLEQAGEIGIGRVKRHTAHGYGLTC